MTQRTAITAALFLTTLVFAAHAEQPPQPASSAEALAQAYADEVRPFLARHCLACHSGEKPKRELDLDRLAADFSDPSAQKQWLTVLERIESGEMPPKAKPRP